VTFTNPQREWWRQPAWWALFVGLLINVSAGLWDRARMEQKIEDVDGLVRQLLILELERHKEATMPRAHVSLIPNTDLVYPIISPGFTDLTASDLGSGFPLADGFDEVLLQLSAAVADDMKGLGIFDSILAGIDDGDGAVGDATLNPVMDSFAANQTQGQPVVDEFSNTLGLLTGGTDATPPPSGGGGGASGGGASGGGSTGESGGTSIIIGGVNLGTGVWWTATTLPKFPPPPPDQRL
jgi:hypothetical protein